MVAQLDWHNPKPPESSINENQIIKLDDGIGQVKILTKLRLEWPQA